MKSLKLSQRLLGSSALVIATFVVSAVLVGASLGDVRRDADFLRGDAIPGMTEIGKLRLLVSTNITRIHGLVLIDNSDERKAVEGEIREAVQAQSDLLAKYTDITTEEEKRLNARVKEAGAAWAEIRTKVIALADSGDLKGAQQLLTDNTSKGDAYLAAVDEEFELNIRNGKAYGEHIAGATATMSRVLWLGGLLAPRSRSRSRSSRRGRSRSRSRGWSRTSSAWAKAICRHVARSRRTTRSGSLATR